MNIRKGLRIFFFIVFVLSQSYWMYWIYMGIDAYRTGVNTGWLVPALANPNNIVYGMEAVQEVIGQAFIVTALSPLALIPLFQLGFIIAFIVTLKKKHQII